MLIMINPINTTNAIYTAREAMKAANSQFEDASKKVAEGNIQVDKIVNLKKAEMYSKVQHANMKAAMDQNQNTLDLLA